MLGWILLAVGWTACLLEILICWVLTYFPMRINWFTAMSAFAAGLTTAALGIIILVIQGINWLINFIF